MAVKPKIKRNFSAFNLSDAMKLVGRENETHWRLEAPYREPSDIFQRNVERLSETFDMKSSEQAKTLVIDAVFAEIVSLYPRLKVWKSVKLDTDTLTGIADYLIAPKRAYLETPLLCVAEAKRDDFERGEAQCVAEMVACQWQNSEKGINVDVHGIVSNGQGWQFYKLTVAGEVFESGLYTTDLNLPALLGALDYVCSECAKNLPQG